MSAPDEAENCEICGESYAVWFAPSDVWNAAMRSGGREFNSFVCPRCFTTEAARELGGVTGWLVTPFNDGPVRFAREIVFAPVAVPGEAKDTP